jgi:hypothetical protein
MATKELATLNFSKINFKIYDIRDIKVGIFRLNQNIKNIMKLNFINIKINFLNK